MDGSAESLVDPRNTRPAERIGKINAIPREPLQRTNMRPDNPGCSD